MAEESGGCFWKGLLRWHRGRCFGGLIAQHQQIAAREVGEVARGSERDMHAVHGLVGLLKLPDFHLRNQAAVHCATCRRCRCRRRHKSHLFSAAAAPPKEPIQQAAPALLLFLSSIINPFSCSCHTFRGHAPRTQQVDITAAVQRKGLTLEPHAASASIPITCNSRGS